MTAGPTGVVWLPRTAAGNSAALLAGPGPLPASAAATAWSTAASAFADVAATVARVGAALNLSWDGVAADAAERGLTATAAWATSTADRCALVAARAGAHAAAVTAARVVMPMPVEIAAVEGTRVAAYSTGGAVTGAAQAADAARLALDVRAAVVMETYEAASATLAMPEVFDPPPPVTSGAPAIAPITVAPVPPWSADPGRAASGGDARRGDEQGDRIGADPVAEHGATAGPAEDPAVTRAASSVLRAGDQLGGQVVDSALGSVGGSGLGERPGVGGSGGGGLGAGGLGAGVLGGAGSVVGAVGSAGGRAPTGAAGWAGLGTGDGGPRSPSPWTGSHAVAGSGDGPVRAVDGGTPAGQDHGRAPVAAVPPGLRPTDDDQDVERRVRTAVLDIRDGSVAVPPVIGAGSPA